MSVRDRIRVLCGRGLDERALRVAVLDEIRASVPFDSYAWVLTDPDSCVGSSPLAETPSMEDLPALIRLKYLTRTNRWTTLPPNRPVTLLQATDGDRTTSLLWRELLAGYGVHDVVSTVLRDQFGCWGFFDLWRMGGAFSADECDLLGELMEVVTSSLRHSLAATFAPRMPDSDAKGGPVVLLLSEDMELLSQTAPTDEYLRALLPTDADRVPVPAGAYHAAAQLLANEQGVDSHPPEARAHVRSGLWVTLRAARIEKRSPGVAASIAVSMELTPPAERAALYGRVVGLSERERDLLHHLVGGNDTRELARRLFVSEHTVQDHLKSIFVKTGVHSRRMLIARATGVA